MTREETKKIKCYACRDTGYMEKEYVKPMPYGLYIGTIKITCKCCRKVQDDKAKNP